MGERNSGSSFTAFLLGGFIGMVLGILYAPRKGEETREKLKDTINDIKEKSQDTIEKVKDTIEDVKDKAEEIFQAGKEKIQEGKDMIDDAKEAVKETFDIPQKSRRRRHRVFPENNIDSEED